MAEATAKVEAVLTLVKAILQLFLAQRVPERLKIRELAHRIRVQLIDTCKSFFANGFLVVGEKQATELFPLEEIFAVVFGFGHG